MTERYVWGVYVDEDQTMRSSRELVKLFSTKELADNYLRSLKNKYSAACYADGVIKKLKVKGD